MVFHPRHRSAVLDGSKTVTVRWEEAVEPGPAWFVFEGSDDPPTPGHVLRVDRCPIEELTAEAAHAPAGTDMDQYVVQLRRNYYPEMPPDAVLDIAVFRVQTADDEAQDPTRWWR